MLFSVLVAGAGLLTARHFYITQSRAPARAGREVARVHALLVNKYYVDELYHSTVVRGTLAAPAASGRSTGASSTAPSTASAALTQIASWVSHMLDKHVVDGVVDLAGQDRRPRQLRHPPCPDGPGSELRAPDGGRRVRVSDGLLAGQVMMSVFRSHLLSIILFTPLAGALVLLFVGRERAHTIRWIANAFAAAGFAVSLPLWFWYQPQGERWQFVERARVDPVDRRLVLPRRRRLQRPADPADDADGGDRDPVLVDRGHRARQGVLHRPAGPADRHDRRVRRARFPALLPVLGSDARPDVLPHRHLGRRPPAVLGDQVLPLHARRQRGDAARHPRALFLRPLRLAGAAYTFDVTAFHELSVPATLQKWIFLAFFLGFAVKVPMFPLHTWLPDAHTDAPTAGSVILAAVMLKMGTYGFLRFSLPDPAGSDARVRADDGRARRSPASSTARSSRWRRATGSGSSPTRASATWAWRCSGCSRSRRSASPAASSSRSTTGSRRARCS